MTQEEISNAIQVISASELHSKGRFVEMTSMLIHQAENDPVSDSSNGPMSLNCSNCSSSSPPLSDALWTFASGSSSSTSPKSNLHPDLVSSFDAKTTTSFETLFSSEVNVIDTAWIDWACGACRTPVRALAYKSLKAGQEQGRDSIEKWTLYQVLEAPELGEPESVSSAVISVSTAGKGLDPTDLNALTDAYDRSESGLPLEHLLWSPEAPAPPPWAQPQSYARDPPVEPTYGDAEFTQEASETSINDDTTTTTTITTTNA